MRVLSVAAVSANVITTKRPIVPRMIYIRTLNEVNKAITSDVNDEKLLLLE